MKRIIVYCEGATEETFVNGILVPYMAKKEVYLTASSCNGVSKYAGIKRDLGNLCKNDNSMIVTTMLDYYGLPENTPGMDEETFGDFYSRVDHIERSVEQNINLPNLHVNLMVHEFEAILFSEPRQFSYCMDEKAVSKMLKIADDFGNPEAINRGYDTAPSKRILEECSEYSKVFDGYNIAKNIGVEKIREKCRHFDQWISWMEN